MAIKKCTCKHEYQDKKYGKGMRLCNPKADNNGYTCTVCERLLKDGGESKKK